MAVRTDRKGQFIALRADGMTYEEIARALHISKATCSRLNKEYETEIQERRQENAARMADMVASENLAQFERLLHAVRRLKAEIDRRPLNTVPTEKLMQLQINYEKAITEAAAMIRSTTPKEAEQRIVIIDV